MEIKALANALVQDFSLKLEQGEIVMLLALVSFMDTFILKCLDLEGKLTNTIWIKSRLLEIHLVLAQSKTPAIKPVVEQVVNLEEMIYVGEMLSGKKINSRDNYRPPSNRKKP
jgi:hypothetical protein